MPPEIDHVILTRFNLPSAGPEGLVRARPNWLRERIALFEKYTIPSVVAQTERNFSWIVYFDPDSPEWLKERIVGHGRAYTPLFRAEVSPGVLVEDLARLTGGRGERLITSNLDNDDGIALDFVARIQAVADDRPQVAVFLTKGLIKSAGRLYSRTDRHNAFCSVVETWTAPRTCWSEWHNLLATTMPVVELAGQPGWLQVVHGSNVSNRVRGRRISAHGLPDLFGTLLDDVSDVDGAGTFRTRFLVDRYLAGPLRSARDLARGAVKGVLLRVLGKSGLDRAKYILARAARPLGATIGRGPASRRGVRHPNRRGVGHAAS